MAKRCFPIADSASNGSANGGEAGERIDIVFWLCLQKFMELSIVAYGRDNF